MRKISILVLAILCFSLFACSVPNTLTNSEKLALLTTDADLPIVSLNPSPIEIKTTPFQQEVINLANAYNGKSYEELQSYLSALHAPPLTGDNNDEMLDLWREGFDFFSPREQIFLYLALLGGSIEHVPDADPYELMAQSTQVHADNISLFFSLACAGSEYKSFISDVGDAAPLGNYIFSHRALDYEYGSNPVILMLCYLNPGFAPGNADISYDFLLSDVSYSTTIEESDGLLTVILNKTDMDGEVERIYIVDDTSARIIEINYR